MKGYQICENCVMDTSDSKIQFDENGVCDHCRGFKLYVQPHWHTDTRGRAEAERIAAKIREQGRGREFDSILGLSGGLDSSYMLHVAVREFGLRPLVFHVDGGWNSQIAVHNIESLVNKLDVELFTEVIDWSEMKDFQLAFFKSAVPHIDVPQDHAFIATLYNFADKHKIKYILNGGNFSTECVRNPLDWLYYGTDMRQIKDIQRRFGTMRMTKYPFSSVFRHKIFLRYFKGVEVIKLLNYVPFTKELAIDTLRREYGWQSYPQKHFESRFTRFYEGYWLPTKFGYDTRRVQYSSLILTGQMSRENALLLLQGPAYDPETIANDIDFVASKLEIPTDELLFYHKLPNKSFRDYKNSYVWFELGARVMKLLGLERAVKR